MSATLSSSLVLRAYRKLINGLSSKYFPEAYMPFLLYFFKACLAGADPQVVCEYIIDQFDKSPRPPTLDVMPVSSLDVGLICTQVENGFLTSINAHTVFQEMWHKGLSGADRVIDQLGLKNLHGSLDPQPFIDTVFKTHKDAVGNYRKTRKETIDVLVRKTLRQGKGHLNPSEVSEKIIARLNADKA